jgi:hypothetical protein
MRARRLVRTGLSAGMVAGLLLLLVACGGDEDEPVAGGTSDPGSGQQRASGDQPQDGPGSGGQAADDGPSLEAAGADGSAVLLERVTVFDTDPVGVGGPALTLLVPQGWTQQGGPVWRHEYSNLATYEGTVTSPDGFQGVQFFPTVPQIWQDSGIPFFPEGSNYLGNDVRAPIGDVGVFLETLILPNYRTGFGPRIISRESLPDVAALWLASSLPGTEAIAERLLTEHTANGVTIHEEFTIVITFTPNPGIPGALIWGPQQIFSVRAPASEFEAARPVLQAVATSPVVDVNWFAGYSYVLDLSIQNGFDAIRAAGEASRIISQTNAEISGIIMDTYNATQASNDRIAEAWSQTIRGVETYSSPFEGGATYELPNGYNYVYGFEDGKVILTNEPAFDPVQAFPGEVFELLEVKR